MGRRSSNVSLATRVATALFSVGSGLVVAPASAQSLRGLLLEGDTQLPIALGQVTMLTEERDSVVGAITDEDGFFSLTAPEAGSYRLVASALGYRGSILGPFELVDGGVQVVQFQLALRPVSLRGFLVSAERLNEPEVATLVATGFYDRLAEGKGEFLTPGEIARSRIRHTPQLFREMTTVYLARVLDGRASAPWNDRVLIRSLKPGRTLLDRVCQPRVYVDDVFLDLERMDPQPTLGELAPRDELEAIEVYVAPFGAPLRYQSTSDCGVILLWTKRRR